MARPIPDRELVYSYCSSIFSGANAHVRQLKKVTQVLSKHKRSITALTDEYSLNEIATVARQLLMEGIFESPSRAKLRFPELFQQSEPQESSSGGASGADVAEIDARAAHGILPALDEEGEEELQEREHDEPHRRLLDVEPLEFDGSAPWISDEQG